MTGVFLDERSVICFVCAPAVEHSTNGRSRAAARAWNWSPVGAMTSSEGSPSCRP